MPERHLFTIKDDDSADWIVFLDGVEQKLAIAADTRGNYIIRYVTNANDLVVLTKDKTEYKLEAVHGVVKVERRELKETEKGWQKQNSSSNGN